MEQSPIKMWDENTSECPIISALSKLAEQSISHPETDETTRIYEYMYDEIIRACARVLGVYFERNCAARDCIT